MPEMLGSEPSPLSPPVREFTDGTAVYWNNLQELREAMVEDDVMIIDAIAGGLYFPVDTRGTAQAHAVEKVKNLRPNDEDLEDLVELVSGLFPIIEAHGCLLSSLSACGLANFVDDRVHASKLATVFKWNESEGIAPAQQARNIDRAVELSRSHPLSLPQLPDIINEVYEYLVPATVAIQQKQFARTRLLPEEWDLGTAL